MKSIQYLVYLLSCLSLLSCKLQNESAYENTYAFRPETFKQLPRASVCNGFWDKPAKATGTHQIIVDLEMQHAKYYIGNTQVGYSTVSTGKEGKQTPRAIYRVLSKDIDHRSNKYGKIIDINGKTVIPAFVMGEDTMPEGGRFLGSDMGYGLQLNYTGIWMHRGLVTSAPESAGCIRLPEKMAKVFFENIPVGASVVVQ